MRDRRGKRSKQAAANTARIRPPAFGTVASVKTDSNSDFTGAEDGAQWKFKIVFLGNSGVGKTWLVERVLAMQQLVSSSPGERRTRCGGGDGVGASEAAGTVGLTVNLSKARLTDGRTVLLQLWDTSGQDKYRNLVRNYIPGADCIVILYEPSAGMQATRQTLARWHEFAKDAAAPTAPLVAVVAVSRRKGGSGGGDRGSEEAAAAGVNFGRVFASSLCGCFFHHHQSGSRREGQLTPRWLAEQLVKRQLARSESTVGLLAEQRLLLQQQATLAVPGKCVSAGEAAATDVGCFWCQKLLCCRAAMRCGGGSSALLEY